VGRRKKLSASLLRMGGDCKVIKKEHHYLLLKGSSHADRCKEDLGGKGRDFRLRGVLHWNFNWRRRLSGGGHTLRKESVGSARRFFEEKERALPKGGSRNQGSGEKGRRIGSLSEGPRKKGRFPRLLSGRKGRDLRICCRRAE